MASTVEPVVHMTILQVAAVTAAAVSFLAAFWFQYRIGSVERMQNQTAADGGRKVSSLNLAVANGIFLSSLVLVSRIVDKQNIALPLSDYFDAFLLLGLLLSVLWVYLQWTRHLRALAAFLLPMIFAALVVGIILGLLGFRHFEAHNPWVAAHVASVLLGTASFAAGCVGGIAYLMADRRLKRRGQAGSNYFLFPSLASIEKFTRHAIVLGFALLTVAAITGIFRAVRDPQLMGAHWYFSPKVILTAVVWLVYGSLLHVRLAPVLRGARCAWLSIIGFALLLTVFAVML